MRLARVLEALRRRRQRQRTREWARRFRDSADYAEKRGPEADVHPDIHAAMIASFRAKADELEEEAKQL